MLELIWPPYSLFSSSTASFHHPYHIPPWQASSPRPVWCRCRGPLPPSGGRVVYRVGWVGGENRFGYIAVFMVVLGTVQYLSRCRVAVRCQRRFRKHIGTGSY